MAMTPTEKKNLAAIKRTANKRFVKMTPKYPHVEVQLTGEDGNAFFIIGRVTKALKRAGIEKAEADAFTNEAMSGDYDNVLQTTMRWVSVA